MDVWFLWISDIWMKLSILQYMDITNSFNGYVYIYIWTLWVMDIWMDMNIYIYIYTFDIDIYIYIKHYFHGYIWTLWMNYFMDHYGSLLWISDLMDIMIGLYGSLLDIMIHTNKYVDIMNGRGTMDHCCWYLTFPLVWKNLDHYYQ